MNILILSASNPFHASGVVALDLYKDLKQFGGNEVQLLTKAYGQDNDSDIIFFDSYFKHQKDRIFRKLRRIIFKSRIDPDYLFFDFDETKEHYRTKRLLKRLKFKPDAIIVLFMTRFLNYKNIYELNKLTGAKIYIYPMDMEPITGGCHYAWSCKGYTGQCGTCPALLSTSSDDQSRKNLKFKQEHITQTDVTVLACNTQIYNQITSSTIFKEKKIVNNLYTLPDKNTFKRLNKSSCREHFGLKENQRIFFFGAVSLTEKRKGMEILKQALQIVSKRLDAIKYEKHNLLFLIAGSQDLLIERDCQLPVKKIGFVSSYEILAKAYNASDFFISPSIEETGPTMVLQSIYCETPVISFNIGYSIDLLNDTLAGFIVQDISPSSLADCILKAIFIEDDLYKQCKDELEVTGSYLKRDVVNRAIAQLLQSQYGKVENRSEATN